MLILALDSSAAPASAALLEDGKILSEFYINTKQTHSQTLMPMVESVLKLTNKTLDLHGGLRRAGFVHGGAHRRLLREGTFHDAEHPVRGRFHAARHGGERTAADGYRLCCDGRTLRAGV